MIIACQSLGWRPILVLELFTLVPVSLEQPAAVCPFSQFSCYLQETSEDTSLWFGLSPIDTVTPHGLLLRKCFLDFAVEHWFGCRVTEPGFARDIGAIEVCLIDWLIDRYIMSLIVRYNGFWNTTAYICHRLKKLLFTVSKCWVNLIIIYSCIH